MKPNYIFYILFIGCLFRLSELVASENRFEGVKYQLADTIGNAVIEVEYAPEDQSGLVWKNELLEARVIPTKDGKGIRITLPNSDPAKVVIMDKKGKSPLKTIMYVSPAIIDVSDLPRGDYQLILSSHNVVVIKTFKKKN